MLDRDRFPVDPWRLVERRLSLEDSGVTETLFALGNGYLGMRGNHPEGRQAHEHGTFINGFHETWPIQHPEQAYGFAEVGQTIVNAPDAKVMRVYVDDEPLALDFAELTDYSRELDFHSGVLRRDLTWETPSGKRVRVEMERLVSFEERHFALQRMTVTMLDSDAPVTISSQLVNRQDGEDVYGGVPRAARASFDPRQSEQIATRVLQPQEHWQEEYRSILAYRTSSSGMTLAVAADHIVDTENEVSARRLVEPDIAKNVFRVRAKAGVPIRVTKLISYHTSPTAPTRELVDRCRRTLDRVLGGSIDDVFVAQRAWLDDFWKRSDVLIGGHPELQQSVRWCLFQIAQAAARADGAGVSAKGVTGSGYSGPYFWDTEIYVLPFLAATSPRLARNALRMRALMLPAARRRAHMLNEAGALFPWRTINGEEASAYYAAGTAQYHINADVTSALAKYVNVTGDESFLQHEGIDIAVETARLWETLGFWRRTDEVETFHIHGVTGPDEYTTVVNDNLYTNVMARFNLRFAADALDDLEVTNPLAHASAVRRLHIEPHESGAWRRAAEAMAIPFSESAGIHPQDSLFLDREVWDLANTPPEKRPLLLHFHPLVIYRFQVLKQADVVLALFLRGDEFTPEEKLADFNYYDPLTTGDSTLSAVVQSIMAAEVGYQDLALEYFYEAVAVDLADLHHNAADGVHIASAGGVWSALVSGFGGMRDTDGSLSFDPRLPESWPSLDFPILWHGHTIRVTVQRHELRLSLESGGPITVKVRGEVHVLTTAAVLAVPLADQGPVRKGRPGVSQYENVLREDGTQMSPMVPSTESAARTAPIATVPGPVI